MAEAYLQRLSVKEIAANLRLTQQTVNRHLGRALDELSLEAVQRERLVDAVTSHEKQLLQFLDTLVSIVAKHDPERYAAGLVSFPPGCLESTRDRLVYSALEEHTKDSDLWGKLQLLRSSAARFERLYSDLLDQLVVVSARLNEDESQPSFDTDRLGSYLAAGVLKVTLRSLARDKLDEFVEGGKHLFPSPDPDKIRAAVGELSTGISVVLDGKTIAQLRSCWDDVCLQWGEMEEEIERIRLRQILPGQCDLCPRLIVGPSSARRRTAVQR